MKDFWGVFFIVAMATALGMAMGAFIQLKSCENQAVENKAAYWHPETREFTWGQLK